MSPSHPGLVDFHAHFVTDSYIRKASAAGHQSPDGVAAWPSWSAERHIELMDRCGIDTAFLSMSSPGVHFGDDTAARALAREVNEHAAEAVRDHPGRFGLFASLPLPDVDGTLDEIAYAYDDLAVDGVILQTNTHGIYLGNPRLEPVFAELDRRSAVVFLHPTSPAGWQQTSLGRPLPMAEFFFDTARSVIDLVFSGTLERHPHLKVVVPHCGGVLPVLADRIDAFIKLFTTGSDAPDAVARFRTLYYDTAGTAFPRQIPALMKLADPQRVLFGSDYCWTPAAATETFTAAFDIAEQPEGTTWRSLTTTNAHRLLPRLATAPAQRPAGRRA
ncbi:amidohydrolase family protein [Streptomyces sp. 4F14]|uniref:amidohydrolase family protein n=1 Tax=Streptomyces sp. 4F14 TaxID=3394380 RepID=UPI003A8BE06D